MTSLLSTYFGSSTPTTTPSSGSLSAMDSTSVSSDASPEKQQSSCEEREDGYTLLFTKQLPEVSLQEWYDTCWSEGQNRPQHAPFYGPWLEEQGQMEIQVGEWESAGQQQERVVTFKMEPAGFLTILESALGSWSSWLPSSISAYTTAAQSLVTQTQRYTSEAMQAKLHMTVRVDGMPFTDSFCVHIEWMATEQPSGGLDIQVAVAVEFVENTSVPSFVASIIESHTVEKTKQLHLDLFQAMERTFNPQEQPELVLSSTSTSTAAAAVVSAAS